MTGSPRTAVLAPAGGCPVDCAAWHPAVPTARRADREHRRLPGAEARGGVVTASADHAAERSLAEKLGIEPGAVVQVLGAGDDVDRGLLDDVAARTGTELIVGDVTDEVVDVVLLWWREGDGDLVDALMDALTDLGDHGVVWLLTPKAGRPGHVEPSDIDEAAPTAGLSSTRSTSAAPEWSGTRLVSPRAARGKSRR